MFLQFNTGYSVFCSRESYLACTGVFFDWLYAVTVNWCKAVMFIKLHFWHELSPLADQMVCLWCV